MNKQKVQLILSLIFIFCYISLLGAMFFVEISDDVNMTQGENSLMGELTVLLGVMTGGVSLILNFWFRSEDREHQDSSIEKALEAASKRSEQLHEQRRLALSQKRVADPDAPLDPLEDPVPGTSRKPPKSVSLAEPPTPESRHPEPRPTPKPQAPTLLPEVVSSQPAPMEIAAKAVDAPEESVGSNGNNLAADVRLIQSYLMALGYFREAGELEWAKSKASDFEIAEVDLKQTIKAIKRYQLYGLGIQGRDGRIDPRGNTLRHLLERMTMIESFKSYEITRQATAPVLSDDQWISQFASVAAGSRGRGLKESEKARPGKPNKVCCWDTAQAMVRQKVKDIKHHVPDRIPTLFQGDIRSTWVMNEQTILGAKYIDWELEAGNPVFVGVDDGRTANYNSDGTTEHYLVLVGKVMEQGSLKYRFFDPGTTRGPEKGYAMSNLLTLQTDHTLSGSKPGSNSIYTVSQVRQNIH